MYIRRTIIEGFMPFRERADLSFKNGGIVGIKGAYGDDFAESNRAGKSSFVDAQVWGLYGKARDKKVKDLELIHNGSEVAYVSNEIYDPLTDTAFWVTRTRNSENKGSLEITGMEGEKKKASQEQVDKAIGMNYEEFLFTAFFKQNDIDQFMKADPQKKKSILMNWVQNTNWGVYEKEINEFKKDLVRDQAKIKTQIESFQEFSFDPEELKKEMMDLTHKKEGIDSGIKVFSDELIEKEVQLKELGNVDSIKTRINELNQKVTSLKNSREDSSEYNKTLQQLQVNLDAYPTIKKAQFEEAIDKEKQITSGLAEIRAAVREAETKLKNMDQTMTGFCTLLNEPCSRIEKDPEIEGELRKQIEGYGKREAKFLQVQEKCNKIQRLAKAQHDWRTKKKLLEEKVKNAKGVEQQIADYSSEIVKLQNKIPQDLDARKQELQSRIYDLKDEIQSGDEMKAELDKRLGEIGESLKQDKQKTDRLEALKKELEEVNEQLADAQWVEYMFGKNGIPSVELENSFQEIENDANVILKALNAPFHLEFEAMRELQDWEPSCLACGLPYEKGTRTHVCRECKTPREKKKRDELSLKIYEGGVERPFYLDSGGGQILQSVAIRLALTKLARRRKGSNWGTIFLDELFGQLDKKNRGLMADLITSTLVKELGFEQVFMISHDPNVQSSTATNLIVRRHQEELYSELIMQ